jgi:Transposase zinc-binding domain
VTVQQILPQGYTAFAQRHQLPASVRQAGWVRLACRTARLGGHLQVCPEGPVERVWYHSCRHRRCPPWAWRQVERELTRPKARLGAGDQSHVLLTRPAERRGVWLTTGRVLTQVCLAPVREPRDALLGDGHDLGAQPGCIVALHPWRQPWVLHPPLHCVVTGGGLPPRARGVPAATAFCGRYAW